jgi:cytochrome c oxidase subunit III
LQNLIFGTHNKEDIAKHLVPGARFALKETGAQLFYGLYWLVTGVHAIHLTIGIALVIRLALLGYFDRLQLDENPEIEVTGLYWHLVEVIWIFLYPLIYLPGRVS